MLFSSIRVFVIVVFHFISIASLAQVQEFEPELISPGGQFGLTLSPNGKHALWVHSGGKRDTLIIKESKLVQGKWAQPATASFSTNPEWRDIDPMFSPDGDMLIFQSTRPVPGRPARKGFDIWSVKRTGNGWSEPYNLGDSINSDSSESSASLAANGNIYFTRRDSIYMNEIWVSRFVNGNYQQAIKLPAPVNTTNRESNPFISPEEDYLIFFSDRAGSFGDVDLYISFQKEGIWTEPKNLGATINSALAEFCPFVHQRQKRIYFSRQQKDSSRFMERMYSAPINLKSLE